MLVQVGLDLGPTHDAQVFFVVTSNRCLGGLQVRQAEVDRDGLREREEVEALQRRHEEVLEQNGHFWRHLRHEQLWDVLDEEGGEGEGAAQEESLNRNQETRLIKLVIFPWFEEFLLKYGTKVGTQYAKALHQFLKIDSLRIDLPILQIRTLFLNIL